jgi:hypothetical protein
MIKKLFKIKKISKPKKITNFKLTDNRYEKNPITGKIEKINA